MNKLLDTVPASVGSLIKDLSLLRKRAHGGRPSPRRSWDLLDPMAQARMTCRSPGADELPELPLPSSTWLLSTHLWGLASCLLPPKALSPAQLLPLAGWGGWGVRCGWGWGGRDASACSLPQWISHLQAISAHIEKGS